MLPEVTEILDNEVTYLKNKNVLTRQFDKRLSTEI